jgi:hypothetical protein
MTTITTVLKDEDGGAAVGFEDRSHHHELRLDLS